ncbi:arrestin domain-containing protein 3-like [Scomber japonicus]|uniref:arrestin domain-containing protein 3-like n=1 Tax=Scomber japonicus TaxID=13676 RepID=UPI002304F91B|nr:arrestin domain-containing protein 3-like [Scomber japonicus]
MFGETFKNFNISFAALNERNTLTSGDVLTGNISFDLTSETNVNSIIMTLTGAANVHWTVSKRVNNHRSRGRNRRTQTRHYSAKLDFFNLKNIIAQLHSGTDGTAKLPPGRHVYPFACQIPQGDFPPTFHGVHGKIVYSMTVSIDRPWHLSKDFVTELNFVNRINTNQPELQIPLSGTNSKTLCCLWCASGPITLTVTLEKKAFVPGETVRIIGVFSNGSSRTATPKAKLQQKQVVYTHNKAHHKMVQKSLMFVTGQPVSAHISDMHTEMMLTIPNTTPLTISNCSILKVDYTIEVSLSVRASSDLKVLFPIILCDTPVQSLSSTY